MLTTPSTFPLRLMDGYRAFRDGHLCEQKDRYEVLAEVGQKPKTMVIGCCDSRATPEIIFNAVPGELFVVRNVANLVPTYENSAAYQSTSAALEYAVQVLKVEHIVVMGHARCGGVQAYMVQHVGVTDVEPLSPGDYIGKWIAQLEPASEEMVCEDSDDFAARCRALEEASVRHSLESLKTFPCVQTLLEREKLTLHGAWFDISSGELYTLNPSTGRFSQVH